MYKTSISESEATSIAARYAGGIQNDRKYLQKQHEFHANTILSRWKKKKSRDKRQQALNLAAPPMYPFQ